MMTKTEANYSLKQILDKFAAEYSAAAEASRVALMQSSRGGDLVPEPGHLYGNESKAAFDKVTQEYRQQADEILDEQVSALHAKMAEAPTQEAVRVVQMLQLRDELTSDEVDALLRTYGSNVQAYKAIASVASAHKIHVPPCPLDEEMKALQDLQTSLRTALTTPSAEAGHAGDGFISWMKMFVDKALPVQS